jgi:hypothetical protein
MSHKKIMFYDRKQRGFVNMKKEIQKFVEDGGNIRFRRINVASELCSPAVLGAIVACTIRKEDGTEVVGFSFCSPRDEYCKTYGQFLAFKRCTSESLAPLVTSKEHRLFSIKQACMAEAKRLCVRWLDGISFEDLR